jgi:phosphoribosyl 1,2-cyclic phosphodiesterase
MNLRFWGVRGSIPTPEPDRLRYGGNTTCLEIGAPGQDEAVLIDCGSGIRVPGAELMLRPVSRIHILLTHFHWDHIQGLPSFGPLFQSGMEIIFYANRPPDQVRRLLGVLMTEPFFPVPFAEIGSSVDFRQIECGKPFQAGPVSVEAFHLNHPQGAVGFRAKADGQVMVHASDHEHGNPEIDAGIIRAAKNADLLVMDAQYTPEEYSRKAGWGHSSFAHAAEAAENAGVGRLMLFHHDPSHDDEFLDGMLADAKQLFPRTEMAAEGESKGIAKFGELGAAVDLPGKYTDPEVESLPRT